MPRNSNEAKEAADQAFNQHKLFNTSFQSGQQNITDTSKKIQGINVADNKYEEKLGDEWLIEMNPNQLKY